MAKSLALVMWCAVLTVGTIYSLLSARVFDRLEDGHAASHKLEIIKPKPIAVPIVSQGQIQGYAVAQLSATGFSDVLKKVPIRVDDFLVDETIRALYRQEFTDFKSSTATLDAFAAELLERVNARLKVAALKEVLVTELAFVAKKDARQ